MPSSARPWPGAVGTYREHLDRLAPYLGASSQQQYAALTDSQAWRQQEQVEQAALSAGVGTGTEMPVSRATWAENPGQIYTQLTSIGNDQILQAGLLARNSADAQITQALIGGGVLLLTTRESNRLAGRLRRLQLSTLYLAQVRLPHIIDRLRTGEKVDIEEEVPDLEFGDDEIGEVASAFNYAQKVAVRPPCRRPRPGPG